MPNVIDPETMQVDDLPGIWSPVQWELSEDEAEIEMHEQATASMLWGVDAPEAILRLLLGETEIRRAFAPPPGYDPEQQGEWDDELLTFEYQRAMSLVKVERQPDHLYVEYKIEDQGYWALEIRPEEVHIFRL